MFLINMATATDNHHICMALCCERRVCAMLSCECVRERAANGKTEHHSFAHDTDGGSETRRDHRWPRKRNRMHFRRIQMARIFMALWHRQRICTPKSCVYKLMCAPTRTHTLASLWQWIPLRSFYHVSSFLVLALSVTASVLFVRTHITCHTQFKLMVFSIFHVARSSVR